MTLFPTDLPPQDETPGLIGPDQLSKALAHPIRREILRRLAAGPESPSTFSRGVGKTVSRVSYHFKVLSDECEVLEPVGDAGVDGKGGFFRLKSPMRFANLRLEKLPAPFRLGAIAALLEAFVSTASSAIQSGLLMERDGTTLSARPSQVDAVGWAHANAVLREANEAVEIIEAESRKRLRAEGYAGEIHAVFGVAYFEAPKTAPNLPPG